jgi:V/A-type H+-transporting ATPase subunit D
MALLAARARLGTARKGAGLLRGKREVLAAELFALLREVVEGRDRLDAALRDASRALVSARALHGDQALASLGDAGRREVPVVVEERRVWGVPVHRIEAPRVARAVDARGASPHSWGAVAAEAALRHEEALDVLLGIASRELYVERLGEEIRDTTRRINALEQLVAPRLAAESRRIALALEERGREEALRLKRFKRKRGGPA